jgi:uncharacterized FAD-dependent dehydrogenase
MPLSGQVNPNHRIHPVHGANDNCVYRRKYNASQRRKIYSFCVSDTIKLVSFRYQHRNYPINGYSIVNDSFLDAMPSFLLEKMVILKKPLRYVFTSEII